MYFKSFFKRTQANCHGSTRRYNHEHPSHFAEPKGEYFKWQIGNGEFYLLHIDREAWEQKKKSVWYRKDKIMNKMDRNCPAFGLFYRFTFGRPQMALPSGPNNRKRHFFFWKTFKKSISKDRKRRTKSRTGAGDFHLFLSGFVSFAILYIASQDTYHTGNCDWKLFLLPDACGKIFKAGKHEGI